MSLGGLNLAELEGSALESIATWMRQCGDLPMDLADASLLWVAQAHEIRRIATLDRRDFGIYRLAGANCQQNRSVAVSEALQLWLQVRRLKALRQAYRQLGQLQGGDLEAAAEDGVAMGSEGFASEGLDGEALGRLDG